MSDTEQLTPLSEGLDKTGGLDVSTPDIPPCPPDPAPSANT